MGERGILFCMSVRLRTDLEEDSILILSVSKDTGDSLIKGGLSSEFPDVLVTRDSEGNLRYFSVDLWEGTPDYLDHIISYLESHPVPGTYTVEELGLHDVPFVEVLKAIKKLYEKKLTTPTQK